MANQSEELASFFVKFQMEGLAPLQKAIEETILKAIDIMAAKFNQLGEMIDASMVKSAKAIDAVSAKVATAADAFGALSKGIGVGFGLASSALTAAAVSASGFVTAGIALSGVGSQLAFWMERLSLTIAGAFGPEIRAAVNAVANFVSGLQSLSQEQLGNIAHILELTTAFRLFASGGVLGAVGGIAAMALATDRLQPLLSAVGNLLTKLTDAFAPLVEVILNALQPALDALIATINWLAEVVDANTVKWIAFAGVFALSLTYIPKIVSGIMAIVAALKAQFAAQAAVMALGGPAAWANIAAAVGIAAGATYALGKAMDDVNHKSSSIGRSALAKRVSGPEAIEAQWTRLATAAVNATGGIGAGGGFNTPEERSANTLEQIRDINEKQLDVQYRQLPAVALLGLRS